MCRDRDPMWRHQKSLLRVLHYLYIRKIKAKVSLAYPAHGTQTSKYGSAAVGAQGPLPVPSSAISHAMLTSLSCHSLSTCE